MSKDLINRETGESAFERSSSKPSSVNVANLQTDSNSHTIAHSRSATTLEQSKPTNVERLNRA
jgi:hypothetical protein